MNGDSDWEIRGEKDDLYAKLTKELDYTNSELIGIGLLVKNRQYPKRIKNIQFKYHNEFNDCVYIFDFKDEGYIVVTKNPLSKKGSVINSHEILFYKGLEVLEGDKQILYEEFNSLEKLARKLKIPLPEYLNKLGIEDSIQPQ